MHLLQFNMSEHSATTEYLPSKYSNIILRCYLITQCDILSYGASKLLKNNDYWSPCLWLNNHVFHIVFFPAGWLLLVSLNLVLKTNCTRLAPWSTPSSEKLYRRVLSAGRLRSALALLSPARFGASFQASRPPGPDCPPFPSSSFLLGPWAASCSTMRKSKQLGTPQAYRCGSFQVKF